MKLLEDLNLIDTRLNLTHLPEVFKCCPKIVRLSVDVEQRTWTDLMAKMIDVDWKTLKRGFKKLTSLNLCVVDVSFPDTWLLIFRILR